MSFKLLPGQSVNIEHSVGGLLEECKIEHVRLMLPLVYNIVYGELMNDEMYKGTGEADRIHGHTVLKILSNSPILVIEIVTGLDLVEPLTEIGNYVHKHSEEDQSIDCEVCHALRADEDMCHEIASAIVRSMPYVPAIRQFMEITGNQLSVDLLDDFTIMLTGHGIESLTKQDREIINSDVSDTSVVNNVWGN